MNAKDFAITQTGVLTNYSGVEECITIPEDAFCERLHQINIPNSVDFIGDAVFFEM